MTHLLFALHLIFAIFIVGPLVQATTTAARGLRQGSAPAVAAAARTARIYAIASVLVVIAGMGLMSQKEDGEQLGKFSDTWIWLSLLLWAAAVAVTLLAVVPALSRAHEVITRGESAQTLTGRVAAAGGVVGLLFVVIVVLMVYQPGS